MGNSMRFRLFWAFLLLIIPTTFVFAAEPTAPATVVEVVKAQTGTFQAKVNSVGTLIAEQGITVKSEISGRVTKIFFKSGQYVEQGAPLVQIYPDILQAELAANQAALELSEVNYKRNANLFKKGAVSSSAFDQAAATLKSDKANVEKTQAQLKQALVTAPFSGFLGIRQISLGDYLDAGTAIVNLEDVQPIFVDFSIPEKYLKQINIGDQIDISSNTYGKQHFSGKVVAKDSMVNPNTRSIMIRAAVPNKDNELVPGSFVDVTMTLGKAEELISIPQTALVYSQQGIYVYKVVNGKAVKTTVELGQRENKNIFVTKGLNAGDEIVVAGSLKLHDGSAVKVRGEGN